MTSPSNEYLCTIPQYANDYDPTNQCAQAQLKGAFPDVLRDECFCRCHNKSSNIVVTEVDDFTYAITSFPPSTFMKYKGNATQMPHSVVAIIIRLPCFCSVHVNDIQILQQQIPCPLSYDKEAEVDLTIPSFMAKINQSLLLNP